MHSARYLLAAVLVGLLIALAAAPASASDGFSTQPRAVHPSPATRPTLVALRAGRHDSFDRVVFQFDGPLPSYSVRYVPEVIQDGSGLPLTLRGSAFLEVTIGAISHDEAGRSTLPVSRLQPNFPTVRDVRAPGDFEAQIIAGIGVAQRAGFTVFDLTGPSRIVIDLAHPAANLPAGSTISVTPSRGPVGTRVVVRGRNCANPGAPTTRLVFQSGGAGTIGAVDLGEIPNDRQGRFQTTVTIPARLDPLQGVGGGRTQSGSYTFTTRPPVCAASFTVTGAATEVLPFTGSRTPLLLVVGAGLTLAGAGLLLVIRRRSRAAT
ncbi:MAG TPA: LPXTG cell wall anchor domain-containing protein [Actinomycetes bacterium]|jgi:LPXTG-motif cell wall-anchored protein|nr:LPXTG cell wall anchor domain-containing protein [Actinomycetes bacterium]